MYHHNTSIVAKSITPAERKQIKRIIKRHGGTIETPSPAGEIMYSIPGVYTYEANKNTGREIAEALAMFRPA